MTEYGDYKKKINRNKNPKQKLDTTDWTTYRKLGQEEHEPLAAKDEATVNMRLEPDNFGLPDDLLLKIDFAKNNSRRVS